MKYATYIQWLFVLIVIAASGAGYWLYQNRFGNDSKPASGDYDIEEPFSDLDIPADTDEDARPLIENTITKTKQMYEEQPNTWPTWIAIGNMYNQLKQHERAIGAFKTSLKIDPANIVGYVNIAETYRVFFKDYKTAAEYYRLAINNHLANPGLYVELARLLEFQLDKQNEVEEVLRQGLEHSVYHPQVIIHAIEFYGRTGQADKQKEMARLLLEKYPNNETFKQTWGHLAE